MDDRKRMQIIFDLDTVRLEQIENNSSKTIYSEIRTFMDRHGFEHIEYSGYVSREPITLVTVFQAIAELKAAFPILDKVVEEMHVTEVGNTYSLNHLFHYNG